VRLFVAINLPEAVRRTIHERTAGLRETDMPARWVDPDRIHLTLKFLGEVLDERRDAAVEALREAGADHVVGYPARGLGAFGVRG